MDVPEGWVLSSYGGAANVNAESLLPSKVDADRVIEYLDIASVPSTGVIGETQEIRFADAPSRARRIVCSGDTIVSTVRPYLRSFAFIDKAPPNLVASTGFAVLSPRPGVEPRFLYQTVLTAQFVDFLSGRMKGSNYPAVNASDVADAPLLIPPLAEQKKIAEILASVDEAIQATQAVIDQTRKIKQALLQQLLTRGIGHTRFKQTEIGEIPESWEVGTVGQLASFAGGNGFRPGDWSDEGLPIIRIQNLNGSKGFNYFAGEPQAKWIIEPGTLLFAWAGVKGVSFGPCLWPGPRGVLNQHIYRITPNPGVDKRWMHGILRLVTARIEAKAHGFKASLLHVHKQDIVGQVIPVPSEEEQDQIGESIANQDGLLAEQDRALQTLQRVKRGLMSDLLSGRVRVEVDA